MKHKFYIGQNVIWHAEDFDGCMNIKAIITEIHSDHYLAISKNNDNPNYNDLKLWIDADTEMYFIDADMLKSL